jgi:hypothetical protein
MNFSNKKIFNISLMLLILLFAMNFAFASDNVTDASVEEDSAFEVPVCEVDVNESEGDSAKVDAQIEVNSIEAYYKEKTDLVGYLKDANGTPIKDRPVSVCINDRVYNRTTDGEGKVTLKINMVPNTYKVAVRFSGDDEFNSAESNALIKIKKAPLTIKTSNFNTYENSDLFFKAKVYNKVTNKAVSGIRVAFKVYSSKTKKYSYYYRTTDEKGVATLNKNLKVGNYKISTQIKGSKTKKLVSYKNSNKKATMNVLPTKEFGCCSYYLQISATESIAGFRRDSTNAVDVFIKSIKWYGKAAVRQHKNAYGYFFHSIVTADGWMIGNGGIDDGSLCRSIEKLAGSMVKANKIKKSTLKNIQWYKRYLNFGHFSIKDPKGNFAVVYANKIITGKLKSGEYFSAPNGAYDYRKGSFAKFGKDYVKAAVKIGATDEYGINRRDITVFHWKATTSNLYKTTSQVKVYAANDNGKLVGRSTAYLKDDITYKSKFFSRNSLPMAPDSVLLGTHNFGNIDKLVKTATKITAPKVVNQFNQTKYFKVTVKNKKTSKAISGVKIKIKVSNANFTRYYSLKTDSKGIVKINTKNLSKGSYDVALFPANNKYLISGKSSIEIKG